MVDGWTNNRAVHRGQPPSITGTGGMTRPRRLRTRRPGRGGTGCSIVCTFRVFALSVPFAFSVVLRGTRMPPAVGPLPHNAPGRGKTAAVGEPIREPAPRVGQAATEV